jgi:DNA-binding Lrp family transcriptional regulator
MDELDRAIVEHLQRGFPLVERPFAQAGAELGTTEDELLARVRALREEGVLSRFGPLYDAERLGAALTLCAMSVPGQDFERVAAAVNAHPEVAHNYEREHRWNMWFVIAASSPEAVIRRIEAQTGYAVMNLPREEAFYLGLHLAA